MKIYKRSLILIILVLFIGGENQSFAVETASTSTIEITNEADAFHVIPINKIQSVRVLKDIDFNELAEAMNISVEDARAGYDSLSEDDKERFHQKRLRLLTQTAQALEKTHFTFGIGRVVGKSFEFIKTTYTLSKNTVRSTLGLPIAGQGVHEPILTDMISADDIFQDLTDYNTRTEPKRQEIQLELLRATPKEKNRLIVESFVKGIDHKLWYQAPLFIASNEYSINASLGLLVEGGLRSTGYGGSEDIGITLAFNDQQKAVIFEIFHSSDQFLKSDMAVAVVGLNMKLNFSMYQRNLSNPTKTIRGEAYYPPAAPVSSGSGPEYYTFGFASSLGVPPPPLADLLTYTNSTTRITWLRLGVSPLFKGYIRLYKGDYKNTFNILKKRFIDIYQKIENKVNTNKHLAKQCQSLF